ncbi:MAG: fibronectin type III domain-containing protein [Bacteroidales bacterium]
MESSFFDSRLGGQCHRRGIPHPSRSITALGTFDSVGWSPVNVGSFTDASLVPDQEYFYRVFAVNRGGASLPLEGSQTTLAEIPNPPSGVYFTSVGTNSMRVNWADNSNDEENFLVYVSTTYGAGYTLVATTAADATQQLVNSLTVDTEYFFRVSAVNSGRIGPAEDHGCPAGRPDGIGAAAGSVPVADLDWTDNSDTETGYVVDSAGGGHCRWLHDHICNGSQRHDLCGWGPDTQRPVLLPRLCRQCRRSTSFASANALTFHPLPVGPSALTVSSAT